MSYDIIICVIDDKDTQQAEPTQTENDESAVVLANAITGGMSMIGGDQKRVNERSDMSEFQPTLRVYRAFAALAQTDLTTPEGVDIFIESALVLWPERTRDEFLEMDLGAAAELVRERVKQVAPLFVKRADEVLAVAQADDVVNSAPDGEQE